MKSAEWICTAEGLTVENMQQQWMTDPAQVSSPSLSTVGPVFGQWSKQNSARSVPILQNRESVQSAETPKARETFLNISRPDTCSLSDNFWILMFKKYWSIIIKTDMHIYLHTFLYMYYTTCCVSTLQIKTIQSFWQLSQMAIRLRSIHVRKQRAPWPDTPKRN